MIKLSCLSLVCLFFASVAVAQPITMQCVIEKSDGWIADNIFFEHDARRNSARLFDGIILEFEEKPKVAQIQEDNAKKLVLSWRVAVSNRGQMTKMIYRLAFFKGSGRVSIQAHPHGFSNNYTARGRCQQIKQPLPTG